MHMLQRRDRSTGLLNCNHSLKAGTWALYWEMP